MDQWILILAVINLILTLPIFTLALLDFTCKLQFRCENLLSFDSMVYICLLRHGSALLSKVLIYGIQLSKNTICGSFSIASIFQYRSTPVYRKAVNF